MFSIEQKDQFSLIINELGRSLDITQTQYNTIVKSYDAVGLHLSKHGSLLHQYNPQILAQGSMLLGLVIQPVHDDDDIDIDLVCQLTGKDSRWTQHDLKQIVGQQLAAHGTYKKMLQQPDGRRCWTLKYSEEANYHMDILPSIVDQGYRILLEKAFSERQLNDVSSLALRITDKSSLNFRTERNHLTWLKSNPFGYARWFFQQADLNLFKAVNLNEAIKPLPDYSTEKLPLQRAIQVLKRHRDMMFEGDSDKPISIIITTLAARAYKKEYSVFDTLSSIVKEMHNYIEERYSPNQGRYIKWVSNPVNPVENFADKWVQHPNRQQNFYKWLRQVELDINQAMQQRGMHRIQESLEKSFGHAPVANAFAAIGEQTRLLSESGKARMDLKSGLTAMGSTIIKPHTFFGNEE